MPINLSIPDFGEISLKFLVLDLNGTIANEGQLIEGVKDFLIQLRDRLEIFLVSADTYGKASYIASDLHINLYKLPESKDSSDECTLKGDFISQLGCENVIALGNGRNDVDMLKNARLGIGVLGHEGIAKETLNVADIVVSSPVDALKFLLNDKALIATLRR